MADFNSEGQHSQADNSYEELSDVPDADANVTNQLYEELLTKTSEYLKSEFEGTAEDYRLIQQLNITSKEKYEELLGIARRFRISLGTMNDRFSCIKPFLERVDAVESQVNELERSVFRLDTYAKQLDEMDIERLRSSAYVTGGTWHLNAVTVTLSTVAQSVTRNPFQGVGKKMN